MSDLGTSTQWDQACEEVCHQPFQREAQTVNVHGVDQTQAALREKKKKEKNNKLAPDTQTHVKHFWTQNQSQCERCNNTGVDLTTCFHCYTVVARMFWVNVVALLYCSG